MWLRSLDWPDDVRQLCERWGFVQVWDYTQKTFGFPASWGLTGSQLIVTQAHFDSR